MFKGHFKTGTVEGTGSAINVELGFTPTFVVAVNIDDAGSLFPIGMWLSGMGSGDMLKFLKVADNGSTGNLSHTLATSNGIDVYAGSAATYAKGFTIGADSDLNASGETILWAAWGEE